MPKNYLDLHGLTLYDGEIKEYIDDEANEIIEITSAEYDQLSYAEKHNGKYYHITDRTSSASLDVNVTQTESSANSDLEVLLSNSASTTTEVSGVKKSAGLKFNPSTGDLTVSDVNTPSGETWDGTHTSLKDAIVSGGGGGSSTLAGLTDVTLTSPTDGQSLTYDAESGKWVNADGSTANIVELTQAEYDALPSSKLSDDIVYMAYSSGSRLDPAYTYYKYGDNDEIIVRVFDEGGSNEKVLWFFNNWTAESIDTTIPTSLTEYAPTTNSPIYSYSYAVVGESATSQVGFYNGKIRSWSLNLTSGYSGIVNSIVDPTIIDQQQEYEYTSPYVYITENVNRIYLNGKIYSDTSSELSEMTLSDYERLSTAQKNDGTARFIPKNDIGDVSALDCTAITGYYENNNVMNVTSTSTEIDVTWNGGVYIGCNFRFNQGIDVTNWDKIIFDVNTSSCYGGGETAGRPDWYLQIGLLVYPITAAINLNPTSIDWVTLAYFPRSNTDYGTVELDVSNLTGTYYLTCVCHGWNATISNVMLATLGGYSSQIKYMGETYGELKDFTGATASANGASGIVPRPVIADKDKFLKGDGTWATVSGGGGSTVTITPSLLSGTKVADYSIDGTSGSLYAPTDTDTNVTQSIVTTNSSDYELIFSGSADNTAHTEGVGKNSTLKCNPSTGNISVSSVTISGTVTNSTDAATKQYVDNLIDTAITQVIEAGY